MNDAAERTQFFKNAVATSARKPRASKSLVQSLLSDDNEPYRKIIYKRKFLSMAFTNDLDKLYDTKMSKIEKLRHVLLSSQMNLIIILLILADLLIGVLELLSDLAEERYKVLELFEDFAELISITIISIFLLEILLKIFFLPKIFFRSCLEMFDFVIVTASLVLECIFLMKKDYSGIGTILTIFRFISSSFLFSFFPFSSVFNHSTTDTEIDFGESLG